MKGVIHLLALTLLVGGVPVSWGQAGAMPQQKISTRIEVLQGGTWVRGNVSEDNGPGASTIGVRLDPNGTYVIVPRSSVRLAPSPATINVGDHLEWYNPMTYTWVPAIVKGIRRGEDPYLMVADAHPNSSGMYSGAAELRTLPGATAAQGTATPSQSGAARSGTYNCYVYFNPSAPVLAEVLHLNPGGTYTTRGGGNASGKYAFGNGKIQFTGGPIAGAAATIEGSQLRLLPAQSRERADKYSSLLCTRVA